MAIRKKILILLLCCITILAFLLQPKVAKASTNGASIAGFDKFSSTSYILMEANSGKVLVNFNEEERMPVASICKLMTSLLTLERLDSGEISLDDMVLVSEHAAEVEGSQAFLDAGSSYTVGELLKSVIVTSANDSAIALAEHIAGSEELFVTMMNDRAKELGMNNTNYTNATGLTTADQYSTAYDTCLILREINKHETYSKFAKIWMDNLTHPSGRVTELVNTNRLIRYYEPCLDGKTGYTDEAGYCLSSVASKNGLKLVAVTLHCKDSASRFFESMKLYDYGFANFENKVVLAKADFVQDVATNNAKSNTARVGISQDLSYLLCKNEAMASEIVYNIPDKISAPMCAGDKVGSIAVMCNGDKVAEVDVVLLDDIARQGMLDIFDKIFTKWTA